MSWSIYHAVLNVIFQKFLGKEFLDQMIICQLVYFSLDFLAMILWEATSQFALNHYIYIYIFLFYIKYFSFVRKFRCVEISSEIKKSEKKNEDTTKYLRCVLFVCLSSYYFNLCSITAGCNSTKRPCFLMMSLDCLCDITSADIIYSGTNPVIKYQKARKKKGEDTTRKNVYGPKLILPTLCPRRTQTNSHAGKTPHMIRPNTTTRYLFFTNNKTGTPNPRTHGSS